MRVIRLLLIITIVSLSLFFSTYLSRMNAGSYYILLGRQLSDQIEYLQKTTYTGDLSAQKDQAREYFETGISLFPMYGWGQYLYGKYLYYNILLDEALEQYTLCLENFDNIDIHKDIGITYYYMQEYDKALHYLNNHLKLVAGDATTLQMIGHSYFAKEEYEKAIEYYSRSVEIQEDANIYNFIGVAYSHLRDFENALAPFERAVELDPNLAPVYENLAALYGYRLQEKQYEKAIESYQKFLILEPDTPDRRVIERRIRYLTHMADTHRNG